MLSNSPNPRKKPSQSRSRVTFNIILEAAARILESGGFNELNTNHVAEKAGVSIGSLYQYFPSKEALIVELLRQERDQLSYAIKEIIQNNKNVDLKTILNMIIKKSLDHQFNRPKLALSLEYASAFIGQDYEEMHFQHSLEEVMTDLLVQFQTPHSQKSARDIIALSKGMINVAAITGETDLENLQSRVKKAVYGYLGLF
ncbi:TetR/AcrR family transcriptional regulator [Acinetobacter sp. MB5]|uniref:TetR/AcrR family transcriptional regulator n=1 Tax=Acinetobacter sp. MB5 TaxID=2069438 RepID=UPI00196A5560|nr:TetR/AcrR family transcriptional regulator [Acinetobacter sp. MB5]